MTEAVCGATPSVECKNQVVFELTFFSDGVGIKDCRFERFSEGSFFSEIFIKKYFQIFEKSDFENFDVWVEQTIL